MEQAYDEKEVASLMHVHRYRANAKRPQREGKRYDERERERHGKGQTALLCLPSCFLDFASFAFHISLRKLDIAPRTNEDLRILVPCNCSAPITRRTSEVRSMHADAP